MEYKEKEKIIIEAKKFQNPEKIKENKPEKKRKRKN